MAAARGRGWLPPLSLSLSLALLLCAPPTTPPCRASRELDRRFAEHKRCADPECSMLMCRGKAVKDFKGPDCRFVDFKEGESVYVYYKLSGRTNDLWAGSVGSNFGYFPKDLLEINHIYTHDELELPTDETDFICFEDGKDDFENYNADELIKLSEDIVDSDTEDYLETEKEEGIEKADPTESIDPENDGLEMDMEESNEVHAEMGEEDNFIFEKNKNVAGSLDSKSENHAFYSNMDNPQGEQSAHQPSEEMLQEMLKVPEHESAKNVTLSQGESKQSDYGSRNDSAYKSLLHQELSEDLKTTFGSTADVIVSDDETTSLVTPLDGDAGQDLDIDSYEVENQEEALQEADEIPLLSFAEEDIKSSDDPESENTSSDDIFESETSDPDYDIREATTKLINEKKDDSDLLTHIGDKIFAIVSGGEIISNTDDFEEEEEEEENNELTVISKEKDEDVLAHSVTSSEDVPLLSEHELIAKKVHNVDISDPKEEKTQEKGNSKSGEEATIEKPQSKSMTIGAFSNYDDGLQSKASIETKEETVKPPLGDIKDDPEGLSFHKIIDREEMKHSEDNLENDTKHKIAWDKLGQTEDKKEKSVNIVSELLEEQINQSQSDVDDDVLEGKTEYDTKRDDKDFELKMVVSEKQVNVSAMKNVAVEEHIEEAKKESKQEKEVLHLEEEDDNDENDLTSSKEILEKKSAVENSMRATQHGNVPQQNIAPKEAEQSSTDGDIDGEELSKTEPQFLELDAEEENFLEEELLQDENALSAKMSKEGLAAEQSFTPGIESSSPQLQEPNDAISRAANPADSGKEATTTLEQAKAEGSMQDLNKENEGMQINEDSQLNEVKKRQDKEEKLLMAEKKHKNLDLDHKMTSSSLNINELENKKDDLNETERHLQENVLQKGFKDKQVTAEDNLLHSHDPSGPIGDSEHTNEATEPEYSPSVRQLTIMHEYLDVKRVERLQKYLGEQHTFRIESLFHDMEQEMMIAQKHDSPEDTEKALDEILETSESNVLDIVNNVFDSRELENKEEVIREMDLFDEEAAIMDEIMELMYSLRQKYSPISESAPLFTPPQSEMDSGASITANAKQTEHDIRVVENTEESTDRKLPGDTEQMSQEDAVLQFDQAEKADHLDLPEDDGNILRETVTLDEMEDTKVLDGDKTLPHVDIVLGSDDLGRTIEKDMIPDLNSAKNDTVEDSGDPSGAEFDASHSIASWDASIFSVMDIMQHLTENMVSTLPEEIRPGPDFHGLPWESIMFTVLVGFATLFFMLCRICLPIKKRIYQVSEEQMAEKIATLIKDKTNILEKMRETEQKVNEVKDSLEKTQKSHSDISDSVSMHKDTSENILKENRVLSDRLERVKNIIQMENEKRKKNKNQFTENQKSLDTLQENVTLLSKKQFELQRTLSESKLNEENMKSELHNELERNAVLRKNKEELLQEMDGWREKDAEQRAQLNFYQKYHKCLEEKLVYKENESEAMTKCIVDLKDLDTDFETGKNRDEGNDLASGQSSERKKEKMKDEIAKMMDTSKVQATFSTCEQEIIYLQAKQKEEVTIRHALEEKMKNLELKSSSLRASKIQTDNELKMLHQKLDLLNEHFQKKEMLLEKQLAEEEYELLEKQQKLYAAAEKADLTSKEVKLYKQKIAEKEQEFKKTERRYKEEIAANEKKAHENWLLSRALERKLAAEQKDSASLRHQLLNVNKQLEIIQSPLFRNLTSYQPDHPGLPHGGPLSQDGSFGPSPVSGEAPSTPLMAGFSGQPLPANLREGLRGASMGDGPPLIRRHSEQSERMSNQDLGPSTEPLIDCRPKISSFVQEGMVNTGPTGPPSFSRIPMTYQAPGPLPGTFPHQTPYEAQPFSRPQVGDGPSPPNPRHYPPHAAPFYPRDYPPGRWPPYSREYTPRPRPPFPRDYPPGPWPVFPNDYPPCFPPPFPRDYPPGPPFGMQDVPPRQLPPPEQRGNPHGAPLPFWPPPPRHYDPGFSLPQQGVRDSSPSPVKDLPPAGPNNNQGNCAPRPSLPPQGVSAYPPPPFKDLPHAGTNTNQVDCVPHAALPQQGVRGYSPAPPAKDLPPAGTNNKGDCDPRPSIPLQGLSAYPPSSVEDLPHAGTNNKQIDCVPHAALPLQGARVYPPTPPAKDLPPAGPNNNQVDCVSRPLTPQGARAYPPPVKELPPAGPNNHGYGVPHPPLPPQGARFSLPPPVKDLPPAGHNQGDCFPHAFLPPQGARVYPPPPLAKDIPRPVPVNQGLPPNSFSASNVPAEPDEMV